MAVSPTTSVVENLSRVRDAVDAACERSGRDPDGVWIVGACKNQPAERIIAAAEAGLGHFGDNYVQQALKHREAVSGHDVVWHMIGHLQRNKVKQALGVVDWIQTLDSVRLAEELSRRAQSRGLRVPVLVEVNVSGEESKFGVAPEKAAELVAQVAEMQALEVRGLMTIGSFSSDPNVSRAEFAKTRELANEVRALSLSNVTMEHLSMGMSHDYPIAVEEGATMVRIGTALFGPRE